VGGEGHASTVLPPRLTRYHLSRSLDGPSVGLGRCGIISLLTGIPTRSVQTVANRYTNCAIPAPGPLPAKVGEKISLRCIFLCTLFCACDWSSSHSVVLLSKHFHTFCATSEAFIISWNGIFRSILKSGSFMVGHYTTSVSIRQSSLNLRPPGFCMIVRTTTACR
jgi:hypothetical protein